MCERSLVREPRRAGRSVEDQRGFSVGLPLLRTRTSLAPLGTAGTAVVPVSPEQAATPMDQHHEAVLLSFVELLVQRPRGVGELLQPGRNLRHRISVKAHALDRVGSARRAGAGRKAIGALLGKIADRAFHRRPILFLIGRELEPSLEPGDARIGEGANVFGRRPPAARAVGSARLLLRVDKRRAGDHERGRPSENRFPHGYPLKNLLMRTVKKYAGALRKLKNGQIHTAVMFIEARSSAAPQLK